MAPSHRETVLCRYRYDPLDRVVSRTLSAQAGIQCFYCKSRLATEIQGAVQHSIFQHDDQLLAQLGREDVTVGTSLLATDQQRSVLNVLDATGSHPPLAYTPYGHRPAENGLLGLLGFNGEPPDPVTGHYLLGNGYRAFNPVLMRFNSLDSLSPFGKGGVNTYGYGIGDPINRSDPTGHIPPFHKIAKKPPTLGATTSTLTGARGGRVTKRIPNPKPAITGTHTEIRALVEIAEANEKKLGRHDFFTPNKLPTDDPILLWNLYQALKTAQNFQKHPSIYKKLTGLRPDGTKILSTLPFDTRVNFAESLSLTANVTMVNNFLRENGLPQTAKSTHGKGVLNAKRARFNYIYNSIGLDLTRNLTELDLRQKIN
ncbi:RHS repeat-associated core domain-containing protein [Pseudomonas viciae]|uniref:RHS repeat-associated core domain-containing protein n=1 Tax=Pseudomonas viciae TaxID=2505979 RepID=A0ABY8PCW2_9PSED|nr:RHS repeat-associated core domain-containing protein [Pseudomonas viciae]WGO93031.1 RHS repeat-associated core domain-containing protein [Pseudomonas viciae]